MFGMLAKFDAGLFVFISGLSFARGLLLPVARRSLDHEPMTALMSEPPYSTRLIAKGRAHALYYTRGLYEEIAAKNLFLWAQAIAFKVLVTVVPIVILATGVAGRILRGEDAFAAVARFINDFLPRSQSEQVVDFLHQLQMSSGTIVGIGGVGLFLSAVSLFITLRIAVGNAFEQDWHEGRSVIGGYLFDVRMVLQVGVLFLVTIGMSVFVQSIEGPEILAFAGLDQPWFREGWQRAIQTMGLFVPFLITTAMFFQLYYLVPKPHPRKRSAFSGALVAGVLWEIAKQIFTYYATYVGQFEQYATEGLGAIGNTFALIVAFVFWVYFSGIVLMIGAVVASLREHRYVTSGLLPGEHPDPFPKMSSPKPPTGDHDEDVASPPPDDLPSPARRPSPAMIAPPHESSNDGPERAEAPDPSPSDSVQASSVQDDSVQADSVQADSASSTNGRRTLTGADSADADAADTDSATQAAPNATDTAESEAPPPSSGDGASDTGRESESTRNGTRETESEGTHP